MKKLLTVAVFAFFTVAVHSQDSLAKANIEAFYNQSMQQQHRLYNGIQHTGYSPSIKGHAYYLTRDWQKGSLFYDGTHYDDVPMIYDVYKDQVVIKHSNETFVIGLVSPKVRSFDMPGHRFVRVEDTVPGMQSGFYEVLAEGPVTALARRTKTMRELINNNSNRMDYEFMEHNRFYIKKDGAYRVIRSEGQLLDVLDDQRAQVKQFLRKNNIRYGRGAEQAIVEAVKYYASLKRST